MALTIVREPIYQQLNQALRDLIRGRDFKAGDQFLTERQICERFGVSRATANKALSSLVAEGLLEFRKGVGTFVREAGIDYDLRALIGFSEKARAAGKQPVTEPLHLELLAAKDTLDPIIDKLKVGPDEPVYYVERLRFADGVPVILEHRYIVARHCRGLTHADLAGSLYQTWDTKYGLSLGWADQTIRAVSIGGAEARLLRAPSGTAGFLVMSTGYLASGEPLWWEHSLFRGDAYEFHNRMGPARAARPVDGALLDVSQGDLP